jgi:hypothetical protein
MKTKPVIGGVRIEPAPSPTGSNPLVAGRSRVTSVRLAPGEEVDWHWTHGPAGSHVSGYTIRQKEDGPFPSLGLGKLKGK